MAGAEIFRNTIEQLLSEKVATDWIEMGAFKFEVPSGQAQYPITRISKDYNFLTVSLGNYKFPDDPVVRFFIAPSKLGLLHYHEICYLNGISLTFFSEFNPSNYDIRPEELDVFLLSWAQILMNY